MAGKKKYVGIDRSIDEGVVYMYTNKINGKSYIGQTWRESARRKEHKHVSNSADKYCFMFHFAIRKYGIDNFEYKVLVCDGLVTPVNRTDSVDDFRRFILEPRLVSLSLSNRVQKILELRALIKVIIDVHIIRELNRVVVIR